MHVASEKNSGQHVRVQPQKKLDFGQFAMKIF
jgi:hypothetical protein